MRSSLLLITLLFVTPAWSQIESATLEYKDMRLFFRALVKDQNRSVVRVRARKEDATRKCFGVVVSETGLILTKASELDGEIQVLLDGKWFASRQASIQKSHDLAIIHCEEAKGRQPLRFADHPLAPGQWLISLGTRKTPVGVGIISLLQSETTQPGWLGVQVGDDRRGAKVGRVEPDSPALEAGLETGDVIQLVGSEPIKGKADLLKALRKYQAGDKVTLKVWRDYDEFEFTATLGWPPMNESTGGMSKGGGIHGPRSQRRAGFPATVRHDTVLKPEVCGSVVLNSKSQVVGLNIARVSRTHTAMLPAKLINEVLPDLLRSAQKK